MIRLFVNSSEECKDANLTYLSGYSPDFAILAQEDNTNKRCLFVAGFECGMYEGIKTFAFDEKRFRSQLLKYFGKRTPGIIGINKSSLSVNSLRRIKKLVKAPLTDISTKLRKARMIKSKKELESIRAACMLTDRVFSDIVKASLRRKFRTEKDISDFIRMKAIEYNSELAFSPVVATAANASLPHHVPSSKRLSGFTVIDLGLKSRHYCSDMTRTLYFGNPGIKELSLYNRLLSIQEECIASMHEGVALKHLDTVARNKLGKYLTHSLGHGVGIQVHELPDVGSNSKGKLCSGMVVTIEPGYYGKDKFGIRIEDTVAFVHGKPVIFTKSSKQLIVVRK